MKPKDQRTEMFISIQEVADISLKENYRPEEISTDEKESSLSSSDFSEETGIWLRSSTLKPRKQLHKRKGIPRRAPLC